MTLDHIIIGAGITGLVIAHSLKKSGKNILVLEANDHAGGVIQTLDADGFLLERGPNSLRGTHEFLDLVDELNLHDHLVTGDPKAPAYVYFNQCLQAVPMSPPALIKTKLISTAGKFRLLREPFVSKNISDEEESLASFVERRLGKEILERLVAPFVSGVYAGDPEKLSVQASFPKLAEFESSAGSIFKGAIKASRQSKPAQPQRSLRPYRLCSFRNGMQTLTDALAKSLGDSLQTSARVIKASRFSNAIFQVSYKQNNETKTVESNSLVVTAPSFAAAQIISEIAPEISSLLSAILYTSLVTVPLAYRSEQISRALDGFGFLAPRGQGLRTLGSIWNTSLFENRAPEGWVLLNNFIGGETDRNAITLSDDELISTVHRDLQKVLGISGEPRRLPVTRWPRAIPQYNLGHAKRIATIENALQNYSGLKLLGNYLHGVALGDCIKNADVQSTNFSLPRRASLA